MTRTDASRMGGLALKAKRGNEYFVELGRSGGRPVSKSLAQIRASKPERKGVAACLAGQHDGATEAL